MNPFDAQEQPDQVPTPPPPPLVLAALACDVGQITDLLSKNADIKEKDHVGRTALHAAASTGVLDSVDMLVQAGAGVNARDHEWITPLHLASGSHNPAVVEYLANHGADVNARDKRYQTALHIAAASGDEEVLQKLIELNMNVNVPDRTRRSPLHYAAYNGFEAVTRLLWQHGGDRNPRDRQQRTPVFFAALQGRHGLVSLMLEDETTLNLNKQLQDTRGYTLLHAAVLSGCLTTVSVVLDAGVDVNKASKTGLTALHLAAMGGHPLIAQSLLEVGASVDVADSNDQSPLHKASAMGYQEVIEVLISYSASVEAKDAGGRLPMHLACCTGDVGSIENLILASDEALNTPDTNGNTPMHFAAFHGDSQLLDLLEDNGGRIDVENGKKRLPLHTAARCGNTAAVSFLVDKAPHTLNARDFKNQTPVHAAAYSGNADTVIILANHNAKCDLLDAYQRTPLHYASASASSIAVNALLQRMAKHLKLKVDVNKRSALHLAAAADRLGDTVALLVRDGLAITQGDERKTSPVHIAAFHGHKVALDFMLDALPSANAPAAIDAADLRGRSAVHYAAVSGAFSVVESILNTSGITLDPRDDEGNTPLHLVASAGHAESLQLLMDRGAAANARNNLGQTPLMLAAAQGHVGTVEIMLFDEDFDTDVNAKDNEDRTPVMYACISGDMDCMARFLQAEPVPSFNLQDKLGRTAVHYCAAQGHAAVLVELEEHTDSDFAVADVNGHMPAHIATIFGHEEALKVIMAHAPVNTVDNTGHTPLHYACFHGHEGCVTMLLEEGVKWKAVSGESRFGPLHCACANGHFGCLDSVLEDGGDVIGQNVDAEDDQGRTPLQLAAEGGHAECVASLLGVGAALDKVNSQGRTALMLACAHGHAEVIHALLDPDLESHPNPFLQDNDKQSALHHVLSPESNQASAELVVTAAIARDPMALNIQNSKGETPLHLAASRSFSEIVAMLLEAGADATAQDDDGLNPVYRLLCSDEARACLKAFLHHMLPQKNNK